MIVLQRSVAVVLGLALGLAASPAIAGSGNASKGAKQFLLCRACHTVVKGAPPSLGPNLWGIYGAKAATRTGYAYSPALAKSGLTWTSETLGAFLDKPNALVPGTKMIFGGVRDPAARQDLIAYLQSLKGK